MNHFFTKKSILLVIFTVSMISIISGIYIGIYLKDIECKKIQLESSLMQIYFNLNLTDLIRASKNNDAIELLDSLSSTKLVYIRKYDSLITNDQVYSTKKNKILAKLGNEWEKHPEIWEAIFNKSFKNTDEANEYREFRIDLKKYLKRFE